MNASPAPTVSLDDHFRCRRGDEVALIPQRAARCGHRDTNLKRVGRFRESRRSFRDSLCIARRVGCRLAGSQPGSDVADFVVIKLDDISAGRQFEDSLRIGEWRTQINVEEFQRALDRKQTIQLQEIVWRARRQGTEDKRARFRTASSASGEIMISSHATG